MNLIGTELKQKVINPGNLSWTPEKRAPKSAQHDWQSPTGFKRTIGLPDNFVQSKSHLDSREIYGKTLLRKLQQHRGVLSMDWLDKAWNK